MRKIQVLGPGCHKCVKLAESAKEAIKDRSADFEVEKITDIKKIMEFGVMITPGLVIDGKVVSVGKVLSPDDIKKLL
jgi:small redox-active disulfide protein 2